MAISDTINKGVIRAPHRCRAAWKRPAPKIDHGYLSRYAAQVTSADTGAVLARPEL